MSPAIFWLILGIILCGLEAAVGPGVGIFFAGLAAVCVGALVEFGVAHPHAYAAQSAWFFGLTIVWAVVLWKPLQRFRFRGSQKFNNIIGDKAEVVDAPLMRGSRGNVRWSGTIMLAELAPDTPDVLPVGTQVTIVGTEGNRLIVK